LTKQAWQTVSSLPLRVIKVKTSVTGTIKNVELIYVDNLQLQFIYGIVEDDFCGRWETGDWMVSSFIQQIDTEKLLVHTQNSIYKVDALPTSVSLTMQQFLSVKQGMSPYYIKEHS